MIYSIFADYSTTLYEYSSSMNTGLDEILDIEKKVNSDLSQSYNSRALVKFDVSSISQSIQSGLISAPSFYLSLYSTDNEAQLPAEYTIYSYAVSSSWDRGIGRRFNNPKTTEGASWKYRDGVTPGTEWATGSYTALSTGSFSVTERGAAWYTSSAASQSFSYASADLRMGVNDIVESWLSSSVENNGFIIKRSDSDEQSLVSMGDLQFFSTETHTVYQPKLEIAWDDSSFSTGSLTALTDDQITLYLKNLKTEYKLGSKAKILVRGRAAYPTQTFATSSAYLDVKYLPTSSYYSIRDAYTDETIIDFDDSHTKISCDSNGNYFNYWMEGLHPERFYRFLFKVKRSDTDIQYFDNDYIFKVVR